jgi:carboxymethylenebutenolidase
MPAYLAIPPFVGPVPGVIVIHDTGGLTQDSRSQADWLAEAGFLAVALDLYHRGGFRFCVRTIIHDLIVRSRRWFSETRFMSARPQDHPVSRSTSPRVRCPEAMIPTHPT